MAQNVSWTLGVLLAASCSAEGDESMCRLARTSAPLRGGNPVSVLIGLSAREASAIGALAVQGKSDQTDHCTCVRLGPTLAVTAAHCFSSASAATVSFGDGSPEAVDLDYVTFHDSLDVVAFEVAPGPYLSRASALEVAPGMLVELAGTGLDEMAQLGQLRFAVKAISRIDDQGIAASMTVGGYPCLGDSGGPMLYRDSTGAVKVAGVLSVGSPDCSGEDVYQRLDTLSSWPAAQTFEPAPASDCSSLGHAGRCFGEVAVYCLNETTREEKCRSPSVCGWSPGVKGFRCVDSDPCGGISDLGACDGSWALICEEGGLVSLNCEDCGGSCARSGKTGKVVCALGR